MRSWRLPIMLLAACGLLIGCESMRELDKAAGEWARAHKQKSGATTTPTRRMRSCLAVNEIFTVPSVDVDTAYLRLKRYFGFNPIGERDARLMHQNFRHETLPGVRYWMRETMDASWRPEWGMEQQGVWMSARVEREGTGSLVEMDYCIGGDSGFIGGVGFRAKLKASTLRVVKGGRGS